MRLVRYYARHPILGVKRVWSHLLRTRLRYALHVLRGRPLVYRFPETIKLSGGSDIGGVLFVGDADTTTMLELHGGDHYIHDSEFVRDFKIRRRKD